MKKSNREEGKLDSKSKVVKTLLKQAKVKWGINEVAKKGAFFISNQESLLDAGTLLRD